MPAPALDDDLSFSEGAENFTIEQFVYQASITTFDIHHTAVLLGNPHCLSAPTRAGGLGLGDVKLAFVAGAWLNWLLMATAIEIAALAALAGYGAVCLVAKNRSTSTTRLPFGLFIAPAIWLSWLIGSLGFYSWN